MVGPGVSPLNPQALITVPGAISWSISSATSLKTLTPFSIFHSKERPFGVVIGV